MRAFYSDQFVLPLPSGHRFPMHKYRLLRERVQAELPQIDLVEAPVASDGELALAHTPDYVSAVVEGRLSPAQQREIGFPWSTQMVERSRRSVGATIGAARSALAQGVAVNLAGGTHHAYADRGSGFCVFNDAVVAARLMQAEWHRVHRQGLQVLIVDLDVHQGNGTAALCRGDDSIYTLSMHGERNFPFRKEVSDLDVELPDGCGDEGYLPALDRALAQAWQHLALPPRGGVDPHGDRSSRPALMFYLAGADPHEGDRLGRLKLTSDGLRERDRRVFRAALERGIPVAVSMAGGYGRVIEDTVSLQTNTLSEALTHWQAWQERRAGEAACMGCD
jgi:acetoin utilization deacetylase AcuC-like enzyme